LAGIPLTAGFIGKFYLISFASYHALWLLLGAIILGSAISLAYYLPLIFKLFEKAEVETEIKSVNLTSVTLVYSLIIATLYLGVLPGRFTSFLAWL